MKHASELFPQALNQLIEMGEKARKQREQKERKACGRETARATRKEKQLKLKLQTRRKL